MPVYGVALKKATPQVAGESRKEPSPYQAFTAMMKGIQYIRRFFFYIIINPLMRGKREEKATLGKACRQRREEEWSTGRTFVGHGLYFRSPQVVLSSTTSPTSVSNGSYIRQLQVAPGRAGIVGVSRLRPSFLTKHNTLTSWDFLRKSK